MTDTFVAKLNKKQDDGTYAVEESFPTAGGVFEGLLGHDNIFNSGIRVYTGPQFSGDRVENIIISIPADTPWKRSIKIFSNAPMVYVTYETPGDIVEADDVNTLQTSIVSTQVAVESKAETTYVDVQLVTKADKAATYTKTETDDRIQTLIGAAPAALDTLQELAVALNNDPNFAATMTTQLAGKVDKVAGKSLSTEDYSTAEKTKLAGIAPGANNYVHPATHPASIITQDANNRFVTDADKTNWNGKFGNGTVVMNTNSFGGKRLYINSINNALFNAHKRWNVTGTIYNADNTVYSVVTSAQVATLFNGDYDSSVTIPAGKYLVLNITFNGSNYPGYPYGNVYISHYFDQYSQSAAMSVYSNYAPHGIGWHTYNFADFVRDGLYALIITANNPVYAISQMEFRVDAPVATNAQISQIDWNLDRPGTNEMPLVDKYKPNSLYYNLDMTANKIINLAVPTADSDAANKSYVDVLMSGKANVTHTHAATDVTQDVNNRFVTDTEKNTWNGKASTSVATQSAAGLMSSGDKTKLDGVAPNANNYVHPVNHPPSIIAQDASNRFATDAEKAAWNAKMDTAGGTFTGLTTAQANTSYTVAQVRNVILSTSDAVLGSMNNGDLWIKYV